MALLLSRRSTSFSFLLNPHSLSRVFTFCSKVSAFDDNTNGTATKAFIDERQKGSPKFVSNIHLSPLFKDERPFLDGYDVEVVDNDTWLVKSGLVHAWNGLDREMERATKNANEAVCEQFDDLSSSQGDPDFDEIDNMRIRGNLFYKLEKDSKEFQEYSYDFHRKNSSKKKVNKDDDCKESKRKEIKVEKLPQIARKEKVYSLHLHKMDDRDGAEKKKVRAPTFNQLTGPYHEPFCLDIFISKASIRACIIHRVTSKVVAVAHSISKDMKFDLISTRNAAACVAVGAILAQRALEDDIHDVMYTPRKGERLEGKLQIVLQSIIDNGINVKVKLKQRKPHRARGK